MVIVKQVGIVYLVYSVKEVFVVDKQVCEISNNYVSSINHIHYSKDDVIIKEIVVIFVLVLTKIVSLFVIVIQVAEKESIPIHLVLPMNGIGMQKIGTNVIDSSNLDKMIEVHKREHEKLVVSIVMGPNYDS